MGKNILIFMQNLSKDNRAIHEKVIDTHKNTIDKLFARLDKDNVSEREIGFIYEELKELSRKIEDARKSWKDWVDKIAFVVMGGVAVLIGTYAQSKLGTDSANDDIIDGEYSDVKED